MQTISNSSASSYKLMDGTNIAYGLTRYNELFAWDMSKVVGNDWWTGVLWTRPIWYETVTSNKMSSTVRPVFFGMSADWSTAIITSGSIGSNQYSGFSTTDGTSLWNITLPYNTGGAIALYGLNADYFMVYDTVNVRFHCYSKRTGAELWTSPSFADSVWFSEYTIYNSWTNDNDNFYFMGPDGKMRALSLATGELVWESTAFPSTDYINNVIPYYIGIVMEGGNIYAYAGYSTGYQLDPVPRQAMAVCIDAATGDVTWTLNGGVDRVSAANGYVIGFGIYDNYVYCIGKGQTETSITATPKVLSSGTNVLIEGSVLDMSPANSGTPAVSEEDMSEWMDYLLMQNATLLNNPPTPDGVPVNLFVVKPDGTEEWITTITSDSYGNYAHVYVPTTEGIYKVIAKFEGSESYYSSSAETSFAATPAAAAGGTIEPEQPTPEQPTPEQPTPEEPNLQNLLQKSQRQKNQNQQYQNNH